MAPRRSPKTAASAIKPWTSHDVPWFLPRAEKPFAFSTINVSETIADLAHQGLTAVDALVVLTINRDALRIVAGFVWAGYGSETLSALGVR